MPAPFSILALDLHNTIYDEVMEYGLALEEAVNFWLSTYKHLTRETLYQELSAAHRRLGSDWDEEAWSLMPSLKALKMGKGELSNAMATAEKLRRAKSRQLIESGLYQGVRETLCALKALSVRIFLVTEAASDIAAYTVDTLRLTNFIDGIYSWPSRKTPMALGRTFHKFFAAHAGSHLKKPHPFVLGAVALEEATRKGKLPADLIPEDVFTLQHPADAVTGPRLELRDTPYAPILKKTLGAMLYVGDSKFKDGMLARNAGIAFGYAAYGKRVAPELQEAQQKSLAIMYAATGWDEDAIKLTQDTTRSDTVHALVPDFTFEHSLSEALPLFKPAA